MTFRRFLAGLKNQPAFAGRSPLARRLAVEMLEAREVPAVTLRDIPDTDAPNNVPIFLPLTPTNSPAGPVRYTATTNNAAVATAQVIAAGTSLKLDVTGTDSGGAPFSGTLTIKLFTDVAPQATGTIIQLTNDGFYNGKLFHRVLDGFVAQGGSPNGDGIGGSNRPDVPDEFNRDFTFASPGIVAMANARDDNNNSQFFIADIDTPLSARPQFLNFNHSIVGLLTEGFDTFQRIMTTPVQSAGGEKSRPVNPVTITTATVFEDTENAIVRVNPAAGTSGAVAVTITGSDGTGQDGTETVNVNVLPVNVGQDLRPVNSRAFLNAPPGPVIAQNGTGTFTLTGSDVDNDKLTFAVGIPGDLTGQPSNASVSVDPATGRVTVTPVAGFTGDIQLLAGVRDQTDRAGGLDDPGNFDTQTVTVRVRAPVAVVGTLTVSRTTVAPNQPVLLAAAFEGDGMDATGTVQFFANGSQIGSSQLVDGEARFTATFPAAGDQSVQAKYTPADALFLPGETTPTQITVSNDAPAVVTLSATGAEPGQPPRVRVTDSTGAERFNFLAFDEAFTGGVRVATADVTGDGQDDIVAVPRFGGAPLVRVFDGKDASLSSEVMVFEDTFRGGLYLDVGDGFARGYSQVLVGAGFSGGPRVTLYDAVQQKVLLNYFADDPGFRGGVTVSMSDLQGGGRQHIITGVGKGGGPIVSVYDALRMDGFPVPDKLGSFPAGDINDRTGIRVGAGGLIDGTRRNILVGPFDPETAPLDRSFDPVEQGVFVGGGSSTASA